MELQIGSHLLAYIIMFSISTVVFILQNMEIITSTLKPILYLDISDIDNKVRTGLMSRNKGFSTGRMKN